MITITLRVLGEEWKSKGKTIMEALEGFKIEWQDIKGKGVMIVNDGKKQVEKMYGTIPLRRLMGNRISKQIQANHLNLLIK